MVRRFSDAPSTTAILASNYHAVLAVGYLLYVLHFI
jgi:hypothetical protein